MQYLLIPLLLFLSVFMILLILIQRGKGGGLAGAFGGMGGQSAFGTKAGDVFTRITVVTAILWFFLCCSTILILGGKYGCGRSFDVESAGGVSLPAQAGSQPAAPGTADGAPTSSVPAPETPASETPVSEAPPTP